MALGEEETEEPHAPVKPWVYNDGGREAAGFRGRAGDCFTRAVAIASQRPYREIYDLVNRVAKDMRSARRSSNLRTARRSSSLPRKKKLRFRGSLGNARDGVRNPLFHEVMRRLGWKWNPTMRFGQGCKVHLSARELPAGRLVVRVTKHIVAVIDGVIHDTYDPSRSGNRCVYGYFAQDPVSSRPWVRTPSLTQTNKLFERQAFHPGLRPAFSPLLASPSPCNAPRRVVAEDVLTAFAEAIKGFSDDDSDCEVRHRCRRRRARIAARSS